MKKVLLFLLTIITLGFAAAPLSAQQTVTIGTGTSTSYSSPFDNLWKNSWCENIYLADEINTSGNITSIAYYYGGTATTTYTYQTLKVYMGTTSRSSIANTSDWTPANDLTLVYDGTNITNPTTQGWFNIELDEPFAYDGTDNLVVVVSKTVSAYNSSYTYRYTTTSDYRAMRRHNDSDLSYAEHPGTLSDGVIRETTRANIQLEITPGGNYCAKPATITIGDTTSTSATVAWTGEGTAWNLRYKASSDTSWIPVNGLTTAEYELDNLAPATVYQVEVQTICDGDYLSGWRSGLFVTDCAPLTSLPYATDFETVASGSNPLPYCWDRGSASTTNPYVYASSAYQGSRALYFTTTNPALLPEVDPTSINLAECQISFYAKTSTAGNKLQIGVMDENGVFELVQEFPLTTTYTHYDIPLTSYEGYGTRVALRNSTTTAIYVDNLVLDEVADCTQPVAVTCIPTSYSATFSWISTASLFNIYYKESSAASWESIDGISLSDGHYTLPDLTPNTEYIAKIETACGLEEEFVSDNITFRTTMIAATLPYESTFGEEDTWLLNNGTCANFWVIDEIEAGVNSLFITHNATTHVPKYNIGSTSIVSALKTFQIGTAGSFTLDFDVRCGGESANYDFMKVFLAPTTNSYPAATTAPAWAAYAYSTYAADFSNYLPLTFDSTSTNRYKLNMTRGNTIHVSLYFVNPFAEEERDNNTLANLVFVWNNDSSGSKDTTGAIITNVHLEALSCTRPDSLLVNNITAHTANFTFVPASVDDNNWEYALISGETDLDDVTPVPISETSVELSDLESGTVYKLYVRTVCEGDNYSAWSNVATFTTEVTCSAPRNLTVSQITGNSALVTWQSAQIGATGYAVSYKQATAEEWSEEEQVTESPYMLSGLDVQTPYIVKVRSLCDEGDTNATKTFTTGCVSGGDGHFDFGTTTSNYLPLNNFYKYNYTQQIFLSSELSVGETTLDSIAFYYANTSATTEKNNVTIYLGHTDQSIFTGTDNYIPVVNLQQVYTGNLNCHQGWNTFVFTTPFQYNGTSNLVLAIDDNSGQYKGSGYYFYVNDAGATRSLYYYNDTNNPDPEDPTAVTTNKGTTTNRSRVKFFLPCESTASCAAPNAYLNNITSESVTVNWVPGYDETAWTLEYQANGETEWTPADASNSPSVIDGLEANTPYTFRLRSECGGEEHSGWVTMQARTNCSEDGITYLSFIENFDSIGTGSTVFPPCWSKLGGGVYVNSTHYGEGTGSLYLTTSTANTYNTAITPMFNSSIPVNTLQANFMYRGGNATSRIIVGVMVDPDSNNTFVPIDTITAGENYSDWVEHVVKFDSYTGEGQYIAFKNKYNTATTTSYIDNLVISEIPSCSKPTQLVATSSTADSVKLAWNGLDATMWDIVYGPVGFNPENESAQIGFISVEENPYTLHEIAGGTGYDFYVRSNCGDNLTSEWSLPATAYTYLAVMGTTGTDTLTGCGFTITDNGGLDGNYSINCNDTLVIYPEDDTYVVTVSGIFAGESSVDYLSIYNGTTVNSDKLIKKVYSSMDGGSSGSQISFGPFISEEGPLTLYFHSDGSVQYAGFVATTSCVPAPNCPSPVKNSVTISNIDGHNATVHFTDNNEDHNSWTVHYRPSNAQEEDEWLTKESEPDTTLAYLHNLTPTTTYQVYVTTNCEIPDEIADATYTKTFTTTVACPAPTSLTTTNIAGHVATLNWAGNAESYTIRYNVSGSTDTIPVDEIIEGNTYTFSDLEPSTTYQVHIMANCGDEDGSSTEAHTSFTTTVPCPAPSNITVTDVTTTSATLTWFGIADNYTLWYTEEGSEDTLLVNDNITESTLDLTDLTSNTGYTVILMADCGFDGTSTMASYSFRTACTALELPYSENFNSYTNAATSTTAPSGYPNNVMPNCWSFLNKATSTSNYPQAFLTSSSTYAVSGNCLFFKSSSTTPLYAVMPEFEEDLQGLRITFTYRNEGTGSYNGTLSIGYMTDASNANTFVQVATFPQTTTKTTVDPVLFTEVPTDATNARIAFKYMGGTADNYYLSIDDIYLEVIPTCERPSGLAATGFTTNSIVLSWEEQNESNSAWEIVYGAPGFDPATATPIQANTNPFTVENLDASTNYEFYVRTICSETDMSNWSVPTTQTTACDVVSTFPYTEGFENGLGCWTSNPVTGTFQWTTPTYYYTSSTAPVEGGHIAYLFAGSHNNVTDLISPIFDLTSLTSPYISFNHIRTKYVSDLDSMKVFYKNSATAEPVLLATYKNEMTAWGFDSLALPNPSATYQIIFKGYAEWGHGIGIDAITIADANGSTPVVTLPSVTTVAADPVGQTTATLNATITNPDGVAITGKGFQWKVNGGDYQNVTGSGSGNTFVANLTNLTANTQYFFKAYIMTADTTVYGEELPFTTSSTPTPPATPTVTTNDATYTQTTATLYASINNPSSVNITGKGFQWKVNGGNYQNAAGTGTGNDFSAELTNLTPNTQYFYKAYITTADTTVYGAELSFTTLPEDVEPCATPTGVTTSNITKESITVSWDNVEGVTWHVQYRQVNGTFASADASTNSYVITGLIPETTYEIQVQADCGNDNVSAWSEMVTATTLPDAVNNYLENSVVLYPNPAKEVINVQCTMNEWNGATIEVLDVYGKLLQTLKADSEITQINVSNLANGMYFVRMTTEQGVVTKRFVKK